MPFTLTMPKLSPTMEEGTIVKWHKKEGDQVAPGDVLIEVATDKATVEHEALDGGWLRKILIPEGKNAIVNQAIAIFTEEEKESLEGYSPEGSQPTKQAESPPPPPAKPVQVEVSQPAFTPPKVRTIEPQKQERILASPLAKKLAAKQGLDLSTLQGTGPSGRIMKRDLANAKPLAGTQKKIPALPAGTSEEIALTPMRKVIAQRLQEAKATIPHFYVQQAIDAQGLIAIREQLKNFKIAVTYNDLMIKAVALSLRQHPQVNCGFNAKNNSLIQFKTIDISVAVSIEGGLITPIVTHADYKSVSEISAEVKALATRAKEGKLQPHEYQGGSFTVSNMGMYGVTSFQAIINPPQAAILAVSGISDVPIVKEGAIVPGKQLQVSLSVDHRAIDGAIAAQFIKTLQKHLESPAILLL